ncbi:energy transducer TonB [Bowmanella denitrificans]|uniref:energy transducer TonB n=1 Tax=Bowmanella denitrificans TaxID=366582 RepID=UPI000C9A23EF|nr:energy transducer TonB [Bowmanella denitrificans]
MHKLLLTLVFFTLSAVAQDTARLLSEVVEAMPLQRISPEYPEKEARMRREGWAVVSFVIEPDGTVSNAIVEDSSGYASFERSALNAVQKWTYRPATENGQPVQQCEAKVRMNFRLQGNEQGVTRKFKRRVNEGFTLINAGKLEEARQVLDDIEDTPQWNLYEDAWFNVLKAEYYAAKGKPKLQLTALTRALNGDLLPDTLQLTSVQQKLSLELQLGKASDAQQSFTLLQSLTGSEAAVQKFTPYMQKLKAMIAGDELLAIEGNIHSDKPWHHLLSRTKFSLANIQGQLDKLDVRCQLRRTTFSIESDTVWHVPSRWGQCHLYVYGEQDASFTLVELPDEIPAEMQEYLSDD